ncbi:hypothetical protein IWW57_002748, partial [Coemansia sp. S610]
DVDDDAFMMSEFTFAKYPGDVEGLLLDDGSASSPDEDMTVLDSRRTSRIPSPDANT